MRKRLRFRTQVELADCGAASLATVLDHFGKYVSLEQVREITGSGRDGTTALTIVNAAKWFGLDAKGVQADIDDLEVLPRASLLYWGLSHFVVLDCVTRRGVRIVDPATGQRLVPWSEVRTKYTGVAIVFAKGPSFEPSRDRELGRVIRYLRPVLAERSTLASVVGSSVVLRALALAVPMMTAIVVDRVVPRTDWSLLRVVITSLVVVVGFNFVTSWLRSRLLLALRTRVDYVTTMSFLEHLVALPYTFHLRRAPGDLIMRLRSNSTVREVFTTGTLSAVLDGSFAMLYLVILVAISPPMALLALGLGAGQVGALLVSRRAAQRLTSASLQVEARSQSSALQLLGGMGTLKASGTEARAVEQFASSFADELSVSLERGRLLILLESTLGLLRTAAPLVLLAVASIQVLSGGLTLGAALAVNALAIGFIQPLDALLSNSQSMMFLRSYVERLNDVFDSPVEQAGRDVRPAPSLHGRITAENVSFRYDPLSTDVVRDVSLDIPGGSSVAIVGRSGSGKTTLAHVLLGLYPPTQGRVCVDGADLEELDVKTVRKQLGVVTQDPYLFATSIRENIAFVDPSMPFERVVDAARRASVADDIEAMPMGYDTLVGDGGGLLSGGQRQRIAIARALASRPRIMLLDEATSHLDAVSEQAVHAALEEMQCTRIVVAHRLSTVASADLIVVLDAGRVVETGRHDELVARRGAYWSLVMGQLPADTTAATAAAAPARNHGAFTSTGLSNRLADMFRWERSSPRPQSSNAKAVGHNGEVVATRTHAELLGTGEVYAELAAPRPHAGNGGANGAGLANGAAKGEANAAANGTANGAAHGKVNGEHAAPPRRPSDDGAGESTAATIVRLLATRTSEALARFGNGGPLVRTARDDERRRRL